MGLNRFTSQIFSAQSGRHARDALKANVAANLFSFPPVRVTIEGVKTSYEDDSTNIAFTQRSSIRTGPAGGEFLVQGEANSVFTIKLPQSLIVQTGGGTANEQILIKDFTSSPAASGVIGAGGSQNLYIGATRSALPLSDKDGLYVGTYTVEVIY